jgi:hypothetical protein
MLLFLNRIYPQNDQNGQIMRQYTQKNVIKNKIFPRNRRLQFTIILSQFLFCPIDENEQIITESEEGTENDNHVLIE